MGIVERAADKLREKKQSDIPDARGNQNANPESSGSRTNTRPRPRYNGKESNFSGFRVELDALSGTKLVPPAWLEESLSQEYRRVKRPLLANIAGGSAPAIADGKRIMITSSLPGEGKTFTSLNLARSLARERDYSVLLVDGDVVKPVISRALGMQDRRGLIDILADETLSLNSVIAETDVPGLYVLPAGKRHSAMAELLSSRRMDWLMKELDREPGRILLFDSAPLLATSETQAMSLVMGQIVVVVKAGSTEQRAVQSALALLDPSKAINLLLNQTRKSHGDYYGGYGYYGGYYGGSDGEA
jgi:exopolysaccharide/PEP-CTERM locus tyrosine autokinase